MVPVVDKIRIDDALPPPPSVAPTGTATAPPAERPYGELLDEFLDGAAVVDFFIVTPSADRQPGAVDVIAGLEADLTDLHLVARQPENVQTHTTGQVLMSQTGPWWGAIDHQYRLADGTTGRVRVAFALTPEALAALAAGSALGVTTADAIRSGDENAPMLLIPPDPDWWASVKHDAGI